MYIYINMDRYKLNKIFPAFYPKYPYIQRFVHIFLELSVISYIFAPQINFNMAVTTAKIPVKKFVGQWLMFHFGNPVRFPDYSLENMDLRRFSLSKHEYQKLGIVEDENEFTVDVVIPKSKHKPPTVYHYYGKQGRAVINDSIERLFRQNMFAELGDRIMRGHDLNVAILAWCEKHGIDTAYSNTIKQRYYRIRDTYQKQGIDLRKKVNAC